MMYCIDYKLANFHLISQYIHACMTGRRWLSYNTWCSRTEKDGLLGLRGLKSGDLVIVNISVFFFLNGNYQIIMLDYFSYFRLWNWGCILQIHFFTSWHACYSIWARCRNDSLHYTAGELQTGCMMKFIGPNFYWILKGSSFNKKALVIFWWPVWVIRVFPKGYWVPSLRSGCWWRIGICCLLLTEEATSKSISLYFEAC